jgi:hypothetical protein
MDGFTAGFFLGLYVAIVILSLWGIWAVIAHLWSRFMALDTDLEVLQDADAQD